MMLTTQAQIAAMEGTVGQAAHMAFPRASQAMAGAAGSIVPPGARSWKRGEEHLWAGITSLAAILLLLSGGYRRLEKITTVLVGSRHAVHRRQRGDSPVDASSGSPFPTWSKGLKFTFPAAALALAFSAFGITGVGASELVAYPYWCIEKGYARGAGRGPKTTTGHGGPAAGSASCSSTPGSA